MVLHLVTRRQTDRDGNVKNEKRQLEREVHILPALSAVHTWPIAVQSGCDCLIICTEIQNFRYFIWTILRLFTVLQPQLCRKTESQHKYSIWKILIGVLTQTCWTMNGWTLESITFSVHMDMWTFKKHEFILQTVRRCLEAGRNSDGKSLLCVRVIVLVDQSRFQLKAQVTTSNINVGCFLFKCPVRCDSVTARDQDVKLKQPDGIFNI